MSAGKTKAKGKNELAKAEILSNILWYTLSRDGSKYYRDVNFGKRGN